MNTIKLHRVARRLPWLPLCAALASASAALAQTPPGGAGQSWADQQRSQAWATRKLDQSPRRHEWVSISSAGRTLKGWVDYPTIKGKLPVVLVLHEVFGLTDSTRNTADEIAAMGYIAITPDMLSGFGPGGGDTSSFPGSRNASETVTGLEDQVVDATLDAWADYADKLAESNGKLAIVGLSWGGGAAFRYATTPRRDVKMVAVFYDVGPPSITQGPTRDKPTGSFPVSGIRLPVYGFYGSRDSRVMASLQATKDAMAAAHKVYEPVVYEDADHAYMRIGEDPSSNNSADPPAVKASLDRLQALLKKALK
jgi:carboxymethylenebutenolidase